jgi:uncharacterized RmlC-like cupin family protein
VTSDLRVIRKGALGPDPSPTQGMTRAHAIEAGPLTTGTVSVDPGVMSGWHHHGSHESALYVLRGTIRMESATGAFEAHVGDFIHIPGFVVHRESNPGTEPNLAVFSRAGSGTVTVNVEGPAKG